MAILFLVYRWKKHVNMICGVCDVRVVVFSSRVMLWFLVRGTKVVHS